MNLDIRWSRSTPSTNRLALDALSAPPWTVWVTDHQTAGRGRYTAGARRAWIDSPGQCLLMSIIVQPRVPAAAAPRLTLLAGIAAVETLRDVTGADVRLKWPNDLAVDRLKLGGILVESLSQAGHVRAVVGMGINVNNDPSQLDQAGLRATSLRAVTGVSHDRLQLLSGIVDRLRQCVADLESTGGELGALRTRWESLADVDGRRVRQESRVGTARGIDAGGALRVGWDDGTAGIVDAGTLEWDPQ